MSDNTKFSISRYNANSVIMISGDTNNKAFYIIQEGAVKLTSPISKIIDDIDVDLQKGDFFGVESCMANLPRIDGAVTTKPSLLITILREQFSNLIKRSPTIPIKIIKSFSEKLRKYDHYIASLSLKANNSSNIDEEELLLSNARFYEQHSKFAFAYKIYLTYLKLFPQSKHFNEVKQLAVNLKPYCEDAVLDIQLNGLTANVPKDFLLFSEGEPGDRLFIIQKGKVNITKIMDNKEILIAVLKEGDIFGEMALLENKPRTANAITAEDCTFLIVERKNFDAMVATQPSLTTKLITLLSERTWVAYRQLENLLLQEPLARIWDTLLIQLQKNRIIPVENGSFIFPFSFTGLVKMVGLPEHESAKYKAEFIKTKKFEELEDKIVCRNTILIQNQVEFYQKMLLRKEKILNQKE
ncbi:MAG: cyclic nucleotide-binding domain-containing protein [Spirochaetes bacterium]|nr:cyclic nucleotide-binding domain-containing protein [Spirochaetota bacterium]MBP8990723.1 cyclic nucleotide-binding domain-containing protein [Spirochaetota bacterium]HOV45715.1 cyclic nucleotide-binding domain-containing protein [Exilispira sp.]HQQ18807.1 cyclic nucleotide-binding domain-containing protein [Exilispira sp.]